MGWLNGSTRSSLRIPAPPLVNLSLRYGSVVELIQTRPEVANRFSPVSISPMCNLYSQTHNVEAVLRLSRAAQPRDRDRAAAHDLYWMDGSGDPQGRGRRASWCCWASFLQDGSAAPRHQCARRQDTDEPLLEAVIRTAPLLGARIKLLRAR